MSAKPPLNVREYTVYVIELDGRAWDRKPKLRARNPDRRLDKPCLYVGYTDKTPEERFAKHKAGGRGTSSIVRDYGEKLRPNYYRKWPVATTESEAHELEEKRALSLRRKGFGVWEGGLGPLRLKRKN